MGVVVLLVPLPQAEGKLSLQVPLQRANLFLSIYRVYTLVVQFKVAINVQLRHGIRVS